MAILSAATLPKFVIIVVFASTTVCNLHIRPSLEKQKDEDFGSPAQTFEDDAG
jgi:hypothetical protein